jgi:hypothetical protein
MKPYFSLLPAMFGSFIPLLATTSSADARNTHQADIEEIVRAITSGVSKDGRRLLFMPWFNYVTLKSEDAEAVVYYLKNVLPAVKNEIPAPALK